MLAIEQGTHSAKILGSPGPIAHVRAPCTLNDAIGASNMSGTKYRLSLCGGFLLSAPDGSFVEIKGEKHKALLAMLATGPGQRRSRYWLANHLWSRVDESAALSSLRSALFVIRESDDRIIDFVFSDAQTIGFIPNMVEFEEPSSQAEAQRFLEDLNIKGEEPFEDWRRDWIAQSTKELDEQPGFAVPVKTVRPGLEYAGDPLVIQRPCVVMAPPRAYGDDTQAEIIADDLCDLIAHNLATFDLVDVFDQRDLVSNQFSSFASPTGPSPEVQLIVSVSRNREHAKIRVVLRRFGTGQVLRAFTMEAEQGTSYAINTDQYLEFASQIADVTQTSLLSGRANGSHTAESETFGAIHHLFGLSVPGIQTAAQIFTTQADRQPSALAYAWKALARTVSFGEAGMAEGASQERQKLDSEIAEADVAHALELDASNGLVLAICGHVTGYVCRDLEFGRELLEEALQVAPHQAFVNDSMAMNLIYHGDIEQSLVFARRARRLGRFSPHKFWFDSSECIAQSAAGNHAEAIRQAERILQRRPDFLPVLRCKLAGEHALNLGDQAEQTLFRMQERETNLNAISISESHQKPPADAVGPQPNPNDNE